jgi:plasmid segregation protein ParM
VVKGLDVGYSFTKDNERNRFKSAYTHSDKILSGVDHIIIDGKDYYVGAGQMTSEVDKTNDEMNKVCTLLNLVQSLDDEFYLVLGLPISQHKTQKDKLIESVLEYNKCSIEYDGYERKISIKDVSVFPQGAAPVYTLEEMNGRYIFVDPGGFTWNIALVDLVNGDPHIEKYDTWYKGMRALYSSVIDAINSRYNLKLDPRDAERILIKNELKVRGKDEDLSFLKPVLLDYLEPITDEIRLNYPCDTTPLYVHGGGIHIVGNALKKRFFDVTFMKDSQFANAEGLYNLGCIIYDKYITRKAVRYGR